MLKSLRNQFKIGKSRRTQIWYEGSIEDEEEEEDEDFHVVEAQDEQLDRQSLDSGCSTWDVPQFLGLDDISVNLLCELKLSESSSVLNLSQIQQLFQHLPDKLSVCKLMLVYQTETHGRSLRTLYRMAKPLDACMILIIRDTCGQVFGVVCSAPLRISSSFYGTGQSFLFSFSPHLQVFKWTTINSYFIKGRVDSLLFGGGRGRFGLWINEDLVRGRSERCDTFDNEILSNKEDFLISELEVWALV